ncbi:hypothetical protein KY285_010732 [Solanum tuberosum]|nr:hypothetical protein KY289_011310 [Solanum tuberosum]KAH0735025.1 hypothetical protein KY285_010732 [Solanum tuberosum]
MEALMESSNNKKSWADEVEDEANALVKKKSIWDDFYIAKLANAGYKLEYVTPTKKGEIVEIEMEDIRSEITYWATLWCVMSLVHTLLLQLYKDTYRGYGEEPLQGGIFHFDNKPFTVKEWTLELEFTKVELQIVPIWVKFPGLNFKYWSREGLSKIGSLTETYDGGPQHKGKEWPEFCAHFG